MRNFLNVLVVLALLAGSVWLAKTHPNDSYYWFLPAGFAVGLFGLLREIRGQRPRRPSAPRATSSRNDKWDIVTVAVKSPIVPVPPLNQAYGSLPPHCYQVMS